MVGVVCGLHPQPDVQLYAEIAAEMCTVPTM